MAIGHSVVEAMLGTYGVSVPESVDRDKSVAIKLWVSFQTFGPSGAADNLFEMLLRPGRPRWAGGFRLEAEIQATIDRKTGGVEQEYRQRNGAQVN